MIVLEANYSKKLGLPGYSSHQYSLTVRKEVSDITQVENESRQLFTTLQSNVDRDIQTTGFLPETANGNRNGSGNGHQPDEDRWNCSDKQQKLILKIVAEAKLDKNEIEKLAQDRFGKSVKALNKLEASGLIEELLEQTGQSKPRNARFAQNAGAR
jgi:hypothetical protein